MANEKIYLPTKEQSDKILSLIGNSSDSSSISSLMGKLNNVVNIASSANTNASNASSYASTAATNASNAYTAASNANTNAANASSYASTAVTQIGSSTDSASSTGTSLQSKLKYAANYISTVLTRIGSASDSASRSTSATTSLHSKVRYLLDNAGLHIRGILVLSFSMTTVATNFTMYKQNLNATLSDQQYLSANSNGHVNVQFTTSTTNSNNIFMLINPQYTVGYNNTEYGVKQLSQWTASGLPGYSFDFYDPRHQNVYGNIVFFHIY